MKKMEPVAGLLWGVGGGGLYLCVDGHSRLLHGKIPKARSVATDQIDQIRGNILRCSFKEHSSARDMRKKNGEYKQHKSGWDIKTAEPQAVGHIEKMRENNVELRKTFIKGSPLCLVKLQGTFSKNEKFPQLCQREEGLGGVWGRNEGDCGVAS